MTAVVPADVDTIDLCAGPAEWATIAAAPAWHGRGVLGIEIDPDACATAEAAGHRRLRADVASLDPRAVAASEIIAPGGVRRLIASPPCQGFSMAGKGRGRGDTPLVLEALDLIEIGFDPTAVVGTLYGQCADDRTALVLEPLRWVLELRPEMTCWEQVPAALPLWERCARILRAVGYSAWAGILNAEQYGVPQTRRRAVLIASRVHDVAPPPATHSRYYPNAPSRLDDGVLPWVSMADALGWGMTTRPYPTIACSRSTGGPDKEKVGGSAARAILYRELDADRWIGPTEVSDEDWLRWVYRNGNQAHAARRHLDQPAPTIHFGARANKVEWIEEHRAHDLAASGIRVSVRQAAALQSFPVDYPWRGTKTKQFQQVGNAVPPLLGAHVIAAAEGLALPWVAEEGAA